MGHQCLAWVHRPAPWSCLWQREQEWSCTQRCPYEQLEARSQLKQYCFPEGATMELAWAPARPARWAVGFPAAVDVAVQETGKWPGSPQRKQNAWLDWSRKDRLPEGPELLESDERLLEEDECVEFDACWVDEEAAAERDAAAAVTALFMAN